MRLTDSTDIKLLDNGFLAVFEGTGVATLVRPNADNRFECSWLVEDYFEGERYINECGAPAVGFDNGFMCVNGHSHRHDVEYYEADEAAAYVKAGHALAPNARLMDGTPL